MAGASIPLKIYLVLFNPPQSSHGQVFAEVMALYQAWLESLGHTVVMLENRLRPDGLNLLFCYQYLPPASLARFTHGLRYILVQLEQLSFAAGWFQAKPAAFEALRPLFEGALQVWDYCPENQQFLAAQGIAAHVIPLGTHPRLQRFQPVVPAEYDVLFYGSAHARRFELLAQLEQHCRVRKNFGLYGSERDALIARTRVILNVHAYADLPVLEQVRLFYLLSNGCFVISEASSWNPYGKSLISYPYAELLSGVLDWLARPERERTQIAARGLQQLEGLEMGRLLAEALAALET
ncbi:MAG: glycosyltransferase family protein [Candidatus Sericytochromatia bacterium]